ncbi:uncharacterized protein V6R79_022058 [Siganus canaliculatus]
MPLREAASLLVGLVVLFHTCGVWADVVVNMEDRVEVFRGNTAQIACMFESAEGIGGLTIQWFYMTRSGVRQRIYDQDSFGMGADPGTPFTNRISTNVTGVLGETRNAVLTISDVQVEDEVEFICLIKSLSENSGEGQTKLKVFEAPNRPTIEGVQTGVSVTDDSLSKIGTCEVKNGFPRPNITWYKNNMPLRPVPGEVEIHPRVTSESSGLFSVQSDLSLKVVKEDKDNQFYCEVTYFVPGETRMTESDRINITVLYPSTAVSVWVESPKGKIKEGDSVELRCRGNGNAPSIITIIHQLSGESWDGDFVVLDGVTRDNSGLYTCSSMDTETYEEITGNTEVVVNYLDPAVVMPKGKVEVGQGETVKATCNALSSLPTKTAWFKNRKRVAEGHILNLKEASFDTAGLYECFVTVSEIEQMETNASLTVHVKGAPEIMEQENKEMEENVDNTVELKCNVRGYPAPSISWSTTDGKVLAMASETETEGGVLSVLSFKVTSDMIVFCNASNEFGADGVAFSIKARGSGVIIAVIIICILLLAILGSVLYFLYKKGKICGRSGKQDLTKTKSNKDNIVVEMKSDNTEEAVLLGVNGEKQPSSNQ